MRLRIIRGINEREGAMGRGSNENTPFSEEVLINKSKRTLKQGSPMDRPLGGV